MNHKIFWQALINWFYPNRCLACRGDLRFDERKRICPSCAAGILPMPEPSCALCGAHLPDGGMNCFDCRNGEFEFTAVRCFGKLEGPLRELIHLFKYAGKDRLCEDLSEFLWRAWTRYPEIRQAEIAVPVPLHPANLRERGYNQSGLLAERFSSLVGLKLEEKALARVRKTATQTRLAREGRRENVDGAFEIGDPDAVKGKNVLLIDDVCTTGSTLNECAKALKKAGAGKVFGLALARD